jgi:hypothetical protein
VLTDKRTQRQGRLCLKPAEWANPELFAKFAEHSSWRAGADFFELWLAVGEGVEAPANVLPDMVKLVVQAQGPDEAIPTGEEIKIGKDGRQGLAKKPRMRYRARQT